jgi:hypothetical protein
VTIRTTRTYAVMDVSKALFDEVHQKLLAAGYQQAIHSEGDSRIVLDMHGIALAQSDEDNDTNDTTKSVTESLRESVRSGLLFGCLDEPLDDAGKRVVRCILDRLDRSDEGRRAVRHGVISQVLDIIQRLDDECRGRYDRGQSKILGYANTSALYEEVVALREDADDEDPPHTGDDDIVDAFTNIRSSLEDVLEDASDATLLGDAVQGMRDDLSKIEIFVLLARGYPKAAAMLEKGWR